MLWTSPHISESKGKTNLSLLPFLSLVSMSAASGNVWVIKRHLSDKKLSLPGAQERELTDGLCQEYVSAYWLVCVTGA